MHEYVSSAALICPWLCGIRLQHAVCWVSSISAIPSWRCQRKRKEHLGLQILSLFQPAIEFEQCSSPALLTKVMDLKWSPIEVAAPSLAVQKPSSCDWARNMCRWNRLGCPMMKFLVSTDIKGDRTRPVSSQHSIIIRTNNHPHFSIS